MNHLPVPDQKQRPSHPVLCFGYYEVPFLGAIAEADDDFYAYALANNIVDRDKREYPNLTGLQEWEDADRYLAKVQAWLFFGLIRNTFGAAASAQDFIVNKPSSRGQLIDSQKLTLYMRTWQAQLSKLPKEAGEARIEHVKQSTIASWKFCDRLDHCEMPLTEMQLLVLFSIRILISSIWDMLCVSNLTIPNLGQVFKISTDLVHWPQVPASYRPIAMLMVEYGWCSHEILRLLSTYNLTTLWSITCLHGRVAPAFNHERCHSAIKCVARDIDPIQHQAQHLTSDCSCEAVGPDIEKVNEILRAGGVPLIRCQTSTGGQISFDVITAKRARRHIALSHVWADGIVIPNQNKVYRCQFLKLAAYLEKARMEVQTERLFFLPFAQFWARHVFKDPKSFDIWFDIFCIPTALHPESVELRKQAISSIYPIFAGAEAVLVVDKALTDVENPHIPITEVFARIALSGWMTRCWTFAEASLALKSIMLFCVSDTVVRYSDFDVAEDSNKIYRLLDVPSKAVFQDLLWTAFYPFHVAWTASQPLLSDITAFTFVWNSLTARSTSWPDDVWGIMATLLGYSGKEIMTLEERDRFPALIKELAVVPATFLFRDLPRSSSSPAHMRWIPTKIQGIIRANDGFFGFSEGGIVFANRFKLKFMISVPIAPPERFSFELEDWLPADGSPAMNYEITIHDRNAVVQHLTGSAKVCILLRINEGQSGAGMGHDRQNISGIGCLLLVTKAQPNSIVEADFLSSLSYRLTFEKQPCHLQASWAGPTVILTCSREQWYQPKIRRRKNSLAPWSMSNLLYFGVPAILFCIMGATMIPLWVWWRTTDQSRHVEGILVYTTCGFLVLIALVILMVIFHEDFLFQNWVDSFSSEGEPQRWWKRIMPFW